MAAPEAGQALGAFEAAAVLGVHYSTVARMAEKGLVGSRACPSGAGTKAVTIYDGKSCDENFLDYEATVATEGGTGKRPRAWLHLRPEALKRLRAVETKIPFADAVTTAEAAEILSVHVSFIPRMIARGDIIGRRLWSPRGREERVYLVSRASCVENVRQVRRLQAAGKKTGRPRKFS